MDLRGQTQRDRDLDQALRYLDGDDDARAVEAKDGKRTDDAGVTTIGPGLRDDELLTANLDPTGFAGYRVIEVRRARLRFLRLSPVVPAR